MRGFDAIRVFAAALALPLACAAMYAQAPAAAVTRAIGEVTSVDAANHKIEIKTDQGQTITAAIKDSTKVLRVAPGEKDLKNATPVTAADIATGDRVRARGRMGAEDTLDTIDIYVMTRGDIAQKQQHDREEWQRRGLSGTVEAINPESKQITVKARGREGAKPVIVNFSGNVTFRRYAPDSVRFSDARPSSFAELKTGDQVRALGERSEDGNTFTAEEIVSGSFRNIAGQVKSVNAAAGEIQIQDLDTKKPLTVKVNPDSTLRKLPPMMAMMLARRYNPAAAGEGGAGGRPGGGQGQFGNAARAGGGRPGGGEGSPGGPGGFGGPSGPGGPGGGRGNGDFQQMLERMPAFTLADLKPGDAIIISGTAGADPNRVTAITLVSGVEPLLTAPRGNQALGGAWNFGDIGLPQ